MQFTQENAPSLSKIFIGYIESPLKQPFITALRTVTRAKDIVLVMESDQKHKGYGSATEVVQVTGETLETILNLSKDFSKQILEYINNKKPCPRSFSKYLEKTIPNASSTRSMFEVAYYDIYARTNNNTLQSQLGGKTTHFETCYTISLDTTENMCQQSKRAVELGFEVLKLKLGCGDISQDITTFNRIRALLPNSVKYRIDANQKWTREECMKFLNSCTTPQIQIIEQPVDKHATADLKSICKSTKIDVFADESVFGLEQLQDLIDQKSCDGIVVKLLKTGGLSTGIDMVRMAEKAGIKVMVSSMLETKLGVYSSLILASAVSDTDIYIDLDAAYLQSTEPFSTGFNQTNKKITLLSEALDIDSSIKNKQLIYGI